MWYIIGLFDNIIKLFQYAWIIMLPVIYLIIYLIIKKNNFKKDDPKRDTITSNIKYILLFIFISLLTVRIWGPNFYKIIIGFSICNKQKIVEEKLEEKYSKNFNFISQNKIVIEENAGSTLGQDVNNDYSVRYIFKDDDGVPAIVEYKKNYQSDYYESKRSKYEIEKQVYDYAKEVNFNKKFYVYVESPYELINNSALTDIARSNFITNKRDDNRIIFILTEKSDENSKMITSALNIIYDQDNYVHVNEHVVTEEEYRRAVSFYNSITQQNGIAEHDYKEKFDFNKNNEIEYRNYNIKMHPKKYTPY